VNNQQYTKYQRSPGKQVAVPYIERKSMPWCYISFYNRFFPVGLGLLQLARRGNKAGNAGIGAAGYPAPGFNSAQPRVLQVLPVAFGIAPPAVVGDNEQQVGAQPY